jgi:selenocysteine lyase/cysteine desulfurase
MPAAPVPDPLPSQRHLFDIPDDVAYLNCAYIAPLPKRSLEAGRSGLERRVRPWMIEPADFFTSSEAVRTLFAQLINADANEVALIPAVSYGMAQAAHILPLGRGQTILTIAEEFPSNVYPWTELAERNGGRVVTIARPADDDWTAALLDAIDNSTAMVAVPHCHWTDGSRIDLEAVGAACRRHGAALCIDGSQSLGALPFDVRRIDPDFVATATYKWLLGPYSVGCLYVAPRWHDARPIEQNWIARRNSEDFAGLVNYRKDYQPGARRFDVGERSNFALNPVVAASLELLLSWDVSRIYETLKHRNDAIAARARDEFGLTSVASRHRAGHFLGLRLGENEPNDLARRLATAKVHVSVRGRTMRVTPHLWTSDRDVEALFSVLSASLRRSPRT